MKPSIRLAVPSDAPIMAEIHARSWDVAYEDIIPTELIENKNATRLHLYQRIITEDNNQHYIIEEDGRPIGIMSLGESHIEDDAGEHVGAEDKVYELYSLYLHPDCFGRRIGTIAMDFAKAKAMDNGAKHMILWVFRDNIKSIAFYERCGFKAEGARKIYNCGKDLVSIRMIAPLS